MFIMNRRKREAAEVIELLLWYHSYFQYTIDSSNKDIIFYYNPLRE